MKTVWLIWETWSESWLWCMYEQDGHLAVFDTEEAAKRFVKDHPHLIDGVVAYSEFPVQGGI